MKTKIYKLLSHAKQGLFALALTVFSGTAIAQTTYTFSYTGAVQSIALAPGSYSIRCWGANGGNTGGGIGGYSTGSITITSPTTYYVYVGGAGTQTNVTGSGNALGGWNGGGNGSCNSTYGPSGGGGGGSDVRTTSNTTYANRIIVGGGGGGGGTYNSTTYAGGNGGGTTGGNGSPYASYWLGQPGTQTAGGLGTTESNSIVGPGIFGEGGSHSSTAPASGWSGCGGGGGYYGGSAGGAVHSGGGGGSGYIGGVTSGLTIMFGQGGFVANPATTGDGRVHITELCSISLYAAGNTNSLNPMICSGQSLTLTTNAISNYSWSTGATSSSLVVSPTSNTVYALTATSPSNCTASSIISVSVNSGVPVLSISNPSTNICLGQTATLTASGALTYTWTNPGVLNGQTFAPVSSAIYTVSGQNGCGITTGTTAINVAPLAVSVLATPTIVCEGLPATLSATASVSGFTWQPGPQTGSLITVAPLANTIYTVTASDGTCAGTQTLELKTKTTPIIATSQTLSSICMGQSVTLSASGAGTGGSYSWTPGGAGSSIILAPSTSTSVIVAGTNSLNCTSTALQIILVSQPPPLFVTANKTAACAGDPVILTASGSPIYQWSGGPSTANYTVNPTATTVYTVTGSHTTNTCTIDATITITAIIPNVTITSTVAACEGGSAVIVATGASTYKWNGVNTGANGSYTTMPLSTSVYTLVATTTSFNTNCLTTDYSTVTVNPNPTVTITSAKATICKGETHTLTATGASTYSWSSTATGSVITVKPTTSTIYSVSGVDANGCIGEFQILAKVSACLGINELSELTGLSVYPNPSTGEFVVTANSEIALKIFNGMGQEVRSLTLNDSNDYKVQVKDLSNGVYFVVGENAEGKVNQKIIVTK